MSKSTFSSKIHKTHLINAREITYPGVLCISAKHVFTNYVGKKFCDATNTLAVSPHLELVPFAVTRQQIEGEG